MIRTQSGTKQFSQHKKMKLSMKDLFCKCDQICTFQLVTFTKEVFHGKLQFLCGYFLEFLRPATLLKMSLRHSCFLVNFMKLLRTLFVIEHLRWLLLQFCSFESIYMVMEPLDMAFSSPSCPTVWLSMIQFNLLVFCHIVFLFLV